MPSRAPDWLAQAEEDLASAQLLRLGNHFSNCCFLCHQAAEGALKAVLERFHLVAAGHDLEKLLQEVSALTAVPPSVEQACVRLNKFYIPTRDPGAWASGPPAAYYHDFEADQALQDAQEVVNFAQGLV